MSGFFVVPIFQLLLQEFETRLCYAMSGQQTRIHVSVIVVGTDCDKYHRLAAPPKEKLNRLTGLQTVWNLCSSQLHTSHCVCIIVFMHQL